MSGLGKEFENKTVCPFCNTVCDASSGIGSNFQEMSDGHFSLCIECARFSIMKNSVLVAPTAEELDDVLSSPEAVVAQRACRMVRFKVQ